MRKLALTVAAALAVGTFATGALAQGTAGGDFSNADGNKDGGVSYQEAVGAYPGLTEEQYNQADTNQDGTLNEAEFGSLAGLAATIGGVLDQQPPSPPAEPPPSAPPSAP